MQTFDVFGNMGVPVMLIVYEITVYQILYKMEIIAKT